MDTWTKQTLYNQLPALIADPAQLVQYELKLTESQLRALAEVLTGAGYHRSSTRRSQDEAIILWNNQEKQEVGYRLAALGLNGPFRTQTGTRTRIRHLHHRRTDDEFPRRYPAIGGQGDGRRLV